MIYQLNVTDQQKQHLVVLSLNKEVVSAPAADVVFQILAADSSELVKSEILGVGQIDDFNSLQQSIFDRDSDGLFIRETISFTANGQELDPDAPFSRAFYQSQRDGVDYMRGELTVLGTISGTGAKSPTAAQSSSVQVQDLSRVLFIHQIAIGYPIDVTKEYPELAEVVAWAESNQLIEIDVEKVAYKLTAKGRRMHDSYIEEAQDLIKRFDIYSNVDVDNSGVYFDTGLGRDLRVPAFELEGVDPFRARFLLGINDGEWDNLSNWPEVFNQECWYAQIFAPIEQAPTADQIGRDKMAEIMTKAKTILRQEQQNRMQ